MKSLRGIFAALSWLKQIVLSGLIVGILGFIVFNFYILSSVISLQTFFYVFLVVSVLTDGIFIFIHLPRRALKYSKLGFDPSKLTIVIACYNGENVIAETIEQAKVHVPANQIIVVSDASTDKTVEIAKKAGVRVLINTRNVNKAFSVTRAMFHVKTPYVLVLDDDTLIGKTYIPTSLLDDGYTAVAFNVMPVAEGTILNRMQQFEYRKSMQLGKNLRSKVGAIGNVSGAIGLFRTSDLRKQARLHSGQFGGEDEQRTVLAHLYGEGKGIVFTDSTVLTKAPATWSALLKQRSFRWNLSLPELIILYLRILFSPNHHYLLKSEKAYQLYIYFTDPLRILFFWVLVSRTPNIAASYVFYLALSLVVWFRLRCKDPWWVVILYPPYSLLLSICRFVAEIYWVKIKTRYLFKDKFHRFVSQRKLIAEYLAAVVIIGIFWAAAIYHFNHDMQILGRIRNSRLEDNSSQFQYETTVPQAPIVSAANTITLNVNPNDSLQSIAHRAIDIQLAKSSAKSLTPSQHQVADNELALKLTQLGISITGSSVSIDVSLVTQAISGAQ